MTIDGLLRKKYHPLSFVQPIKALTSLSKNTDYKKLHYTLESCKWGKDDGLFFKIIYKRESFCSNELNVSRM